jgi:hypothetical protein
MLALLLLEHSENMYSQVSLIICAVSRRVRVVPSFPYRRPCMRERFTIPHFPSAYLLPKRKEDGRYLEKHPNDVACCSRPPRGQKTLPPHKDVAKERASPFSEDKGETTLLQIT